MAHATPLGARRRTRLSARARPPVLPLSHEQRGLWVIDQLTSGSAGYHVTTAWRIDGPLDVTALQRAVDAIVARHEILRTRFIVIDDEPAQVIEPAWHLAIARDDLRGLRSREQDSRLQAILHAENRLPFDLTTGPLLRWRLVECGVDAHVLIRSWHHIITDGWSEGVLNRELVELYAACQQQRAAILPPLPVQYADYAVWQRQQQDERALREGLAYWSQQLQGLPDRVRLPADRPRPAMQTFEGGAHRQVLSPQLVIALKSVSRRQQVSFFTMLLTAYAVLLARNSGDEDVVVGAPNANRREMALEGSIGFFVRTLPLRVKVRPRHSLRSLLEIVQQTMFDADQYQDVPFDSVVNAVAPMRRWDATPIFQVTCSLQNGPWHPPQLPMTQVRLVYLESPQVRFDLELYARENDGALIISWLYARALFERARIERLAQHYLHVLEIMASDPERTVESLDLVSPAGQQPLVRLSPREMEGLERSLSSRRGPGKP